MSILFIHFLEAQIMNIYFPTISGRMQHYRYMSCIYVIWLNQYTSPYMYQPVHFHFDVALKQRPCIFLTFKHKLH